MFMETFYGIPNAQKIWYLNRYEITRTLVKKYVPFVACDILVVYDNSLYMQF